MTNRLCARAFITCLVGSVGLSLGCDKSPVAPARVVTPLAVTGISPARGITGDEVRVAGSGFLPGASLTLDGVRAHENLVGSTVITATIPARAAGTVDVVVTNPDGQSRTLTGGFTYEVVSVAVSPTVVSPGGQLTMSWVAPGGRGCNFGGDWVALFRAEDPDYTVAANGHSDLWFVHVCGETSGTSTLNAPTEPGEYEFRYMVDATPAARSSRVTVTASGSQ
jgi:hypothetical protein